MRLSGPWATKLRVRISVRFRNRRSRFVHGPVVCHPVGLGDLSSRRVAAANSNSEIRIFLRYGDSSNDSAA